MPTLTLNSTLNSPLGESSGLSSNVPYPYQVAINGRGYLVDLSFQPWKRQAMRTTSIEQNRTQADTSGEPGEATLNPEALWRRSQDTWTDGAGQTNLDRKESDIAMFRLSKGVNPWDLWRLTLHYDTQQSRSSANTNLYLAATTGYLYLSDGQSLYSTQDVTVGSPTWTAATGTPAASLSSLATDGYNVYAAYGASGLYWAAAGGAASQLVSSALDAAAVVGYANGRVFVGNQNSLYNITSTTVAALPAALMTHRIASFRWVGFAEGNGFAYAAGYAGSKSYIYAITITNDAANLSAPVVAGQLPTGEVVTGIYGYLGFVVIGSNLGFRVATVSNTSTGMLTIGPLIPAPNATGPANVACFDGQGRWVWFGWTNYDSTSTGLGRMDLTKFPVLPQAPAYASDLMSPSGSTVQGSVTSVAYFQNLHVFAVSGKGVYAQHPTNYVPSGLFQSGLITYDLADEKMPVWLDILTEPLVGSVTASLSLESGTFTNLGTFSTSEGTFYEFQCPQTLANWVEEQVTLTAPTPPTSTPALIRSTLRSIPAAVTGNNIFVPIRLAERIDLGDGTPIPMDPIAEWNILETLRRTHQIVNYQEGLKTLPVYVADMDWIPEQESSDGSKFGGVCVVTLKEPV